MLRPILGLMPPAVVMVVASSKVSASPTSAWELVLSELRIEARLLVRWCAGKWILGVCWRDGRLRGSYWRRRYRALVCRLFGLMIVVICVA